MMKVGQVSSVEEYPLVSVVIPTYNRADLLGGCIESALTQDYPHIEVIVVDDGSIDGTPQLCGAYGSRIRYLRKPNGGAASALNYGIRQMEGSWFKWISSDDLLERGGIRTLVNMATKSGADVVYGDFLQINSSGRTVGRHKAKRYNSQDDFVRELWYHFVGSAVGAIIRRPCFDAVGMFDESIRYGEDYDWWLRAALIHRLMFAHVSADVGRYRLHPGQISKAKAKAIPHLRDQIRTMAAARLARGEGDPRVTSHYASMTRRYRKEYAPILGTLRLLGRAPGSSLAGFWAGKIAPGWASRIFWALSPPLSD